MIAEAIIDVIVALLRAQFGADHPVPKFLDRYKGTIAKAVRNAEAKGLTRELVIQEVKDAMTAASDEEIRAELEGK